MDTSGPEDIWKGGNVDQDYFIILEYKGQTDLDKDQTNLEDKIGHSHYDYVENNVIIKANHAFAIAIVQQNENETVTAIAKFNSGKKVHTIYRNDKTQTITDLVWSEPDVTGLDNEDQTAVNDLKEQYSGWVMVGNPFYNYVKPSIYSNSNSTNLRHGDVIYVYDDDINVNDGFSYKQILKNAETSIKPFQMTLVQIREGENTMTLNTNSAATPPYPTQSKDASNNILAEASEDTEIEEVVCVDLIGANAEKDFTAIWNDETATTEFVGGQDVGKLDVTENSIFAYCDNVKAVSKRLPLRNDSTTVIPIGVRIATAGNFTFALDQKLNEFYGQVLLHDKGNNQFHLLDEQGVIINIGKGVNTSRFELLVIPSELPAGIDEPIETSESLDAYVYDGHLVVENIADGSTLSIYDISGRLLYNAPASGDFNYQFNTHGVYMVVLRGNTTGSIKVVY